MSSTKQLLKSKDVNAPVATVRPSTISKLPVPSKLHQHRAKRPLLSDEVGVENSSPPQPKRRCSDTTTTIAPVKRPAAKSQRAPIAGGRSKVTNARATAVKVSRSVVNKTQTTCTTRPAKPTTAYNQQAQTNVRSTTTGVPAKSTCGTRSATGGPKKTKRPAWDLKGRLEDIENKLENRNAANSQLLLEINSKSGVNQKLEETIQQLRSSLEQKALELEDATARIVQQERRVRVAEDDLDTSKRRFQQERDDLNYTVKKLERQVTDLNGDLEASRQEANGLKSSITQLTSAQAGMTAQLAATKVSLEQSHEAVRQLEGDNARLQSVVAEHEATIVEQQKRMRADEATRRRLHNTIQELKGNIRVFCRVRPLLEEETTDGDLQHIKFTGTDEKTIALVDAGLNESSVGTRSSSCKSFEFNFDCIFSPESSQADVFREISQLVQSALDGYNVCVFAYGQTGSGKTFTMEGPTDAVDATVGMIPRAVKQIFETALELQEKGWEYTMEASFLEIYNETVRDLLCDATSSVAAAKKCEIKMVDPKGSDVEVTNSTTIEVTSEDQVHALLTKASHNRAVAATNCNERSSRSHSVFRLKLSGSNSLTGEACQGTLNLVDLAGSERLSQSGSTGDRLRETKNINRSLSNLGNVIMALANKDSHIPYRNSKLTHLLQNSLGGNSKTLMFVNISPCRDNIQESLCSLRFATKVNQCNIGTAQKKVK